MSLIHTGDTALLDLLPYHQAPQWHIPGSWGRDGWDLGEWPYSKYGWVDVPATDTTPAVYGYLSYCEGDYTVIAYATREERDRALDEAALFHWRHRDESWVVAVARRRGKDLGDLTVDDLPARLRGHFSWERLDREKPRT